jgi:nicotinate-nucleotide adenylyltransferase
MRPCRWGVGMELVESVQMGEQGSPKLGIFGGTFDPVHIGHLIVASEIFHALHLQKLLFVPAAVPPHKPDQRITAAEDRIAMLHLSIDKDSRFGLSRVDLDRKGPSFTADTLRLLAYEHPSTQLFFIMGSDSLRDLPNWHEPGCITEEARLVVALRPAVSLDLESVFREVPGARGRVNIVEIPGIGVSSRDIRHRVQAGNPISYLVLREVEQYILSRGLYRL